MSLITFKNASLGYNKKSILDHVTCEVGQGTFVVLFGPNGTGKSTFLKGALQLLTPLSGHIDVDTTKRFVYVPQKDNLTMFWPMTVDEILSLPHRAQRPWGRLLDDERRMIERSMERLSIQNLHSHLFRDLSWGQQQRVILAQALSQQPDVLLLDEPTRGLDMATEQNLLSLLQSLRVDGMTILLVTHSLTTAQHYSDKVIFFHHNRVIETTPDTLKDPQALSDIYETYGEANQ